MAASTPITGVQSASAGCGLVRHNIDRLVVRGSLTSSGSARNRPDSSLLGEATGPQAPDDESRDWPLCCRAPDLRATVALPGAAGAEALAQGGATPSPDEAGAGGSRPLEAHATTVWADGREAPGPALLLLDGPAEAESSLPPTTLRARLSRWRSDRRSGCSCSGCCCCCSTAAAPGAALLVVMVARLVRVSEGGLLNHHRSQSKREGKGE